jgi:hypothetical protein
MISIAYALVSSVLLEKVAILSIVYMTPSIPEMFSQK